jgi:hypothetical protein
MKAHDTPANIKEGGTRLGRFYTTSTANKEFDAITLLQLLDLRCDRRLADVKRVGSSRESTLLRDGVKGSEVGEYYSHSLW